MKNIFKVIPLEVYPFDVCISINQSDKQIRESLSGNEVDWKMLLNLPETCVARAVLSPSNLTIVRFKIVDDIPHGIISHELFHATTFIMDRVGIKFELMTSDEAYAYLLNYLVDKVYEILNNHIVDTNKKV